MSDSSDSEREGYEREAASEPLDQVALALGAIKDPSERAAFLVDPDGYAAKNKVALDPGFVDAIQGEVTRLNRQMATLERDFDLAIPRLYDARVQGFRTRPGEVAILPAIVAVAEVVSAAAIVVIAVTEVYQATKFVTRQAG